MKESPSAWMTANEASHSPALSHRFRFSHGKTTGREEMRFLSFQVGLESEKLTGRPTRTSVAVGGEIGEQNTTTKNP